MQKKNKKGFTIVELVVVIAVIGILSAILIPTFMGLSDNARKQAIQSDLSSIYTQYAVEAADGEMTLSKGVEPSVTSKLFGIDILGQEEVAIKYKEESYYTFSRTDNKWVVAPTLTSPDAYNLHTVLYTHVTGVKTYYTTENADDYAYPTFAGYSVYKIAANA